MKISTVTTAVQKACLNVGYDDECGAYENQCDLRDHCRNVRLVNMILDDLAEPTDAMIEAGKQEIRKGFELVDHVGAIAKAVWTAMLAEARK